MQKIKFSKPDIKDNDLKTIAKIIKSGWLTHGKHTKEFEREFCNYTKSKYSALVSSCTAGLHLIFLSLNITKGDEVIVPAQTHTATSHAVEYTGAKAVFVDVDPVTGNILPEEIIKNINRRTKAVVCVHMTGIACKMDELLKITKKYKIHLIEDCAHGLGTKFNSKHVGNFGIASSFSFYPTKQITIGEGGMVTSNNKTLINKIQSLKAFGINKPPDKRSKPGFYNVNYLGYNYRTTDFQAALGYFQIKRYDRNLKKRILNAKIYHKLLKKNKNIILPNFSKDNSYYVFQIICKNGMLRDMITKNLKIKKYGYGILYSLPVPWLNYYRKKYKLNYKNLINSKTYSKRCISLPCHNYLQKSEIEMICKIINKNLS